MVRFGKDGSCMVKWETTTIGDVVDVLNGDRGANYPKPNEIRSSGVPFINAGHLHDCKIDYNNMEYIDQEHYTRMGGAKLQPNDILFCLRGSLGKYALNHAKQGTLASSLAAIRTSETMVNSQFLFQLFGSDIIAKQIEKANNGSSQPNLSATDVKKFVIPLPPITEQRAIAAVLSDTDAYIAALEKLIAKKRGIKKGAMQELLTGKRRLPGFGGEWVAKTLFELVPNLRMGQSPDSRFYNTDVLGLPLIQGNADIENRKTIIHSYTIQITKCAYAGDIILTVRAPVGNVAKAIFDCCLGRGVCGFSYPNEYLYQWLVYFEPFWGSLSTGSTFDSIPGDKLKEVVVGLPENENEQSAIAQILSDMDAEISALTAKLNKIRNIKQSMMQELLTGRIRLVEQKTETAIEIKPAAKIIELPDAEVSKKPHHGYSEGYEDAVILVALVDAFGTKEHPFTAFDCQKFPYLFHRHMEGVARGFGKFAAGPYNPAYKHKTPLPIALSKKYIRKHTGNYKGFIIDDNAQEALTYFMRWYGDEPLKWLQQFRYITNRKYELELLTTTDKAMLELIDEGKTVTLQAVKELIWKSPAWRDKLKRPIFSDENIIRAIKWSNELFGTETKGQ